MANLKRKAEEAMRDVVLVAAGFMAALGMTRHKDGSMAIPGVRSLEQGNLRGAKLSGADLAGFNLRGCDLSGAWLADAYLVGTDLRDARLFESYMERCYLRYAKLDGADLRRADLRSADLSGASLRGADLRGSILRGAYLDDADLRGANLGGPPNLLVHTELRNAKYDINTKLPDELDPDHEGMIFVP